MLAEFGTVSLLGRIYGFSPLLRHPKLRRFEIAFTLSTVVYIL
uniref:Uncharacterized protein n=1 Tax=Anguilla anguilla TaxID=7936 RepID=A0A0E9U2E0_ANGAN